MSKLLTAVIIDDESSSRNSLRQKLALNCPEVLVIGECENGEEGILLIEEKKPAIVFLDVEMPRINGFTMLQRLPSRNFEVIFITAYDHYAIRAIRFSALDYLVKPVEVDELKDAVSKAAQRIQEKPGNERLEMLLQDLVNDKKERQRMAISSLNGLEFINVSEILYLEASSNYTIIYMANLSKLTVSKTLKEFEDLLPFPAFIRIHHSHIINSNAVEKYIKGDGGQVIMKNGEVLEVAKRKKSEFLKAIGH